MFKWLSFHSVKMCVSAIITEKQKADRIARKTLVVNEQRMRKQLWSFLYCLKLQYYRISNKDVNLRINLHIVRTYTMALIHTHKNIHSNTLTHILFSVQMCTSVHLVSPFSVSINFAHILVLAFRLFVCLSCELVAHIPVHSDACKQCSEFR